MPKKSKLSPESTPSEIFDHYMVKFMENRALWASFNGNLTKSAERKLERKWLNQIIRRLPELSYQEVCEGWDTARGKANPPPIGK